jgi:PEP-CTERM motif
MKIISILCFTSLVSFGVLSKGVHAQTDIYNSTTNFTGQTFLNGGASLQGANAITKVVADKIIMAPSSGGLTVSSFTFSVANTDVVAISARPRVRFWQTDGVGGSPGTLITGVSFNPITFTANNTGLFVASFSFFIPANGEIWAGITFDNFSGTSGATIAQLNNLGQGLFDAPTVGSSDDSHWISAGAGSNNTNNPAGTLTSSPFGGSPVANYGWKFAIAASPAPEPGTMVLFAIGSVSVLVKRRRIGLRRR